MRAGRLAAWWAVPVFLLLVVAGVQAEAQQLTFEKIKRSGGDFLSWRWRGGEDREFNTAFNLSNDAIAEAEAVFRDFNMDTMWTRLEAELRAEVDRSGQGQQVKLTRNRDGVRWSISGNNQAAVDRLAAQLKDRQEAFLKVYLARYLRMRADTRVLVDFAAATTALQRSMRPVARALAATTGIPNTDRARIELALGFFQQIPYAQLEDKNRRGGDFLPGPALLAQNRGDCDSKAVALAAVLRTYTPGRKLVIVTMPGHAILATDLPSTPSDVAIRSDGRQYVALEVAGPLMAAVGQVGSTTARLLKEGRELEVWPLD
jgi:hypothetical protein